MRLPSWVYAIRHDITGKTYVGISCNPKRRLYQHLYRLRKGAHEVGDMQADYNKYGEHLTFSILEEVQTYQERNKEFKWQIRLNTLDRRYGYNYKDPVTSWYNRGKPEAQ